MIIDMEAETTQQEFPATEGVDGCPLCGGRSHEPVLNRSRDLLHRLPGEFAIVRCSGCGLVRLSPRPLPSEIGFYYPPDYCSFHCAGMEASAAAVAAGGAGVDEQPRRLRSVRTNLRNTVLASAGYHPRADLPVPYPLLRPIITRLFWMRVFFNWPGFPVADPRPGRALDIGCGSGAFLRLLQHFGWEVAGVELGEEAAERARQTTGSGVFAGEVQDAGFEPESFDFVHMSHVIEHMADPMASLDAVWKLLRPGGVVYIETPNVDAWNTKPCGRFWIGYDSPRHLYLFSRSTLARTVEGAGLSVERIATRWFPGVYAWEDTYRCEERLGALTDGPSRPRIRWWRRPRAVVLGGVGRLIDLPNRSSADILCCWSRKPVEGAAL